MLQFDPKNERPIKRLLGCAYMGLLSACFPCCTGFIISFIRWSSKAVGGACLTRYQDGGTTHSGILRLPAGAHISTHQFQNLGAPGLASETWESTNPKRVLHCFTRMHNYLQIFIPIFFWGGGTLSPSPSRSTADLAEVDPYFHLAPSRPNYLQNGERKIATLIAFY